MKEDSPNLTAPLRDNEESNKNNKNPSLSDQPSNPTVIFKEFGYRYWICFFYAMSNISLNVVYITCSPITSDLKSFYNTSDFMISSTSLMYLLFYMPANFPSNYILDKYGIRAGVTLGTLLTLLGSWLRILVNDSFYYVILGSFISSIGQPLIFNTPAKIAAYWFKPESRVKATTFLSIISPIGFGVGFLIPGMVIGDTTNMTESEFKDRVWGLFFYQALVFTIICAPGLFFFREKPESPPSASADVEKTDFKQSFILVVKNRNFMMLLSFFALSYGSLNALSIVLNILLDPYGYTGFDTSLIGAVLIVFGLLGSAIVCLWVAATNLYKLSLILCTIGYFIAVFMIGFCAFSYNVYIVLIPVIFLGFFGFPILPICFEVGCEVTFPVGEAFSTGLLVSSSQILATVATIILEFVFTEQTKESAAICFGIFFILVVSGIVFLVLLKEEFKRTQFEGKKRIRGQIENSSVNFVSCAQEILEETKQKLQKKKSEGGSLVSSEKGMNNNSLAQGYSHVSN